MIGKLRVTILGAAVAVSAFGVGGSQCYAKEPPSVGANVDIDVNGIVKSITDAVSSAQNRGGFVKGALETAFNGAKRRHNVMVFNLNGGYDASGLQGVRDFHVYTYSSIPYGVWNLQVRDVRESGRRRLHQLGLRRPLYPDRQGRKNRGVQLRGATRHAARPGETRAGRCVLCTRSGTSRDRPAVVPVTPPRVALDLNQA